MGRRWRRPRGGLGIPGPQVYQPGPPLSPWESRSSTREGTRSNSVRHVARVGLGAGLLLLPGCGGSEPGPPAAPRHGLQAVGECPLPLVRGQAETPVPVRLQVHNDTDQSLTLYLDVCRGHIRAGEVGAGGHGLFRLPRNLYPFRGGLRIHAYVAYPSQRYGTFIAPLGDAPVLDYTLTPGAADAPLDPGAVAGPGVRGGAGAERAGADRVSPDEDRPPDGPSPGVPSPWEGAVQIQHAAELTYLSAWAEGARTVLTWLCYDDAYWVQIGGSGVGALDESPEIVAWNPAQTGPEDGVRWEAGSWEVERSTFVALHGDSAAAAALLDVASPHGPLRLELRPAAGPVLEVRLRMWGLEGALTSFPCA